MELFGNNGFSFSGGSQYGDAPMRRNLYVEVDTMNNAAFVPPPYAGLAADMQTIFASQAPFASQSTFIDTYVEPESSPSLPYTTNIALANCGSVPSCTLMSTYVTNNFSVGQVARQPYFHYVVYGDQLVAGSPPAIKPSSGQAPLLGKNIIVTVGQTRNWNATPATQRGTTMHELGHNLNLTHNQNDDPTNNFSTIHVSIMNYRYQMSGVPAVPGISGILTHTYSYGNNYPAYCLGSPKQRCIIAEYAALVYFGDPSLCNVFDPYCDTDVQEWNHWMTTDFVGGTGNPGPGAGAGPASTSVAPAALQPLTASEFAPFREAIARNLVGGGKPGPLKAVDNDPWDGPVPAVPAAHQRALVQAQVADLQRRGLVLDKDFQVSDDGLNVTQSCL
jgi:hypothetical protein